MASNANILSGLTINDRLCMRIQVPNNESTINILHHATNKDKEMVLRELGFMESEESNPLVLDLIDSVLDSFSIFLFEDWTGKIVSEKDQDIILLNVSSMWTSLCHLYNRDHAKDGPLFVRLFVDEGHIQIGHKRYDTDGQSMWEV